MKFFATILILVCLWLSAQADYITVTPEEFQELDIPVWMVDPVWATFEHGEHYYTAVHVFTDDYLKPYVLLTQDHTDNRQEDEELLSLYGQ